MSEEQPSQYYLFGKDFGEGGIIHLEKGKSFYIQAGHTSKVQVVKMKKSFYAQVADVCAAEDSMGEEGTAALFEEDEAAAAALPLVQRRRQRLWQSRRRQSDQLR